MCGSVYTMLGPQVSGRGRRGTKVRDVMYVWTGLQRNFRYLSHLLTPI